MQQPIRGFTLIELMIVVAIVAILAAIAYPNYQQHVRRTAVTEAELSLNGLAQALERHRAQTGTYAGSADGAGVPTIFRSQSPADGRAQFNLWIDSAAATSYRIRAQSLGAAVSSSCSLTSDELGSGSRSEDCS